MTQGEIYAFLKSHPNRRFETKQIARLIGKSIGTITLCLRKMRKLFKDRHFKFKLTGKKATRLRYNYWYKK